VTSRATVDTFLAQPAIALVGASRTGKKFGNYVRRELESKGYRVYPIHPTAESDRRGAVLPRFADLPSRSLLP